MKRALGAFGVGLLLLAIPSTALASIGVGVGTGSIAIRNPIKSGSIYTLPAVVVFNDGTQTATYTMSLALNQTQPQLKPNPAWFSFSPRQFTLAPGKAKAVIPTFHPPIRTRPGNYFGYLEAHPAESVKHGTTAIGVAAAAKLSFKIVSSNFWIGLLYRISALYRLFAPWSYVVTGLLILTIIVAILRKRLHFSIHISKI